MTEKACFKIREHLLDHHFDELEGLEKQRVEAHLENCADCRSVVDRLGNAFTAATSWEPEPKPGEIDRLVDRLTPYLEQPEPERRFGAAYGVGLALAAGLALFFFLRGAPERAAIEATPLAQVEETPVEAVVRAQPTEHLRVVSSADWNGAVTSPDGSTTEVRMDRGFAVMAFEGGDGRTLLVKTPDLEVEVIGTRFYVDARPGIPTTVGVVTGKVAVKTKAKRELLEAGAERAYRPDGSKDDVQLARSKPYHSDAFLLEAPAMLAKPSEPPPKRKPPRREKKLLPRKEDYVPATRKLTPPEPEPEVKDLDPAEVLGQAERLVRDGNFEAALRLIERALSTEAGEKEPYQATLRYERARILVKQGKRDQARLEFGRLTAAPAEEIAHQARLSLCELELTEDPCTARACLESIESRESKQLLARWRLAELECDGDQDRSR